MNSVDDVSRTPSQQLLTALQQIAELETQNRALRKTVARYEAMNTAGRKRVTALHSRTTKQSTFTNHEVKRYAQSIMDALTKAPLLK